MGDGRRGKATVGTMWGPVPHFGGPSDVGVFRFLLFMTSQVNLNAQPYDSEEQYHCSQVAFYMWCFPAVVTYLFRDRFSSSDAAEHWVHLTHTHAAIKKFMAYCAQHYSDKREQSMTAQDTCQWVHNFYEAWRKDHPTDRKPAWVDEHLALWKKMQPERKEPQRERSRSPASRRRRTAASCSSSEEAED